MDDTDKNPEVNLCGHCEAFVLAQTHSPLPSQNSIFQPVSCLVGKQKQAVRSVVRAAAPHVLSRTTLQNLCACRSLPPQGECASPLPVRTLLRLDRPFPEHQ